MSLLEKEIDYLGKIWRNGLNSLEDEFPNKFICVHSIHWCVEYLIRKSTEESQMLNFKSGFSEILKALDKKHPISPKQKKAIEDLNIIRNDLEHKGIPPDLTFLRELIPEVYNFLKWLNKVKFNEKNPEFDLYRIPIYEERSIYENFRTWKNNYRIDVVNTHPEQINDQIFICIIPSSASDNLVDFSSDTINATVTTKYQSGAFVSGANPKHHSDIESYYRRFRILGHSQVYTIPTFLREYNDTNELQLYPNGIIYISYIYNILFKRNISGEERPIFDPDRLFSSEGNCYITDKEKELYGIKINEYRNINLENLLQVVCFPFHPECKKKFVKQQTNSFTIQIILPKMLIGPNNERRYLDTNIEDLSFRKYLGTETDLVFTSTFTYEDIPLMIQKFKKYIYGFFRNEADTGFY